MPQSASAALFNGSGQLSGMIFRVLPFVVFAMSAEHAASTEPVLAPPIGYHLIWNDEFDREGAPRAGLWHHDTSRNRTGWYNEELQYYSQGRTQNARIENGRLVIEAHADDLSIASLKDWGQQRFSSARLTTQGKVRWKGGFFEIRAKLPCVRGVWPAIWLLPDTHRGRWRDGEIDIAELVGHEPDIVYHSVHTEKHNFRNGKHQQVASNMNACTEFNNYQLLWMSDQVIIGVNGRPVLISSAKGFDRPMSLIMNVAVGGSWGGAQGIDESAFPARMEVEYVRVWQPRETL